MGNSASMKHSADSVVRSFRDENPMDYTLRIQNFSWLKKAVCTEKTKYNRYESLIFNASGYKWKLALYPNGCNHISLYLVTADDIILSANSELNVMFTFLVYDCIRDKYLTVQDRKIRRFHAMKTEWGFEKLVSVLSFNNASNGFLVNDCCAFGVDIVVMKYNEVKGEVLSLVQQPKNQTFFWKVADFSDLEKNSYQSDLFMVEGYTWKINLYPRGQSQVGTTGFLSLFLALQNLKEYPEGFRLFVEYEIVVLSQLGVQARKTQPTIKHWFDGESSSFGYEKFMSLRDVEDPKKGFLNNNNTMIVEVKINAISTLKFCF